MPIQYEYSIHELPKHQKKILLNLNLMAASAQPGTTNWARRPCSNNNNALLREVCVYTQFSIALK